MKEKMHCIHLIADDSYYHYSCWELAMYAHDLSVRSLNNYLSAPRFNIWSWSNDSLFSLPIWTGGLSASRTTCTGSPRSHRSSGGALWQLEVIWNESDWPFGDHLDYFLKHFVQSSVYWWHADSEHEFLVLLRTLDTCQQISTPFELR